MAKPRRVYVCQSCGAQSPRWEGRCAECGEWDSLVEEAVAAPSGRASQAARHGGGGPRPITAIENETVERLSTGEGEFDRVLGGGVVPGSAVLIGGEPGVGKSTLLVQVGLHLAGRDLPAPILYVTAEESAQQVRLRAERLGTLREELLLLAENNVSRILQEAEKVGPAALFIDSIQMVFWPELESAPGSVAQVRECAAALVAFAKRTGCPLFLVGHVTKEGSLAGPKVLEHLVDVVLYFEGERYGAARLVRAVKNRFGATGEIAVFEMGARGLEPVEDPSRMFLSGGTPGGEGSAVTCSLEGTRPFLVEVQALVAAGLPGGARRRISGADANRVSMLLAVLEKRAGLGLSDQDVFANVVGGVQLEEPSADLALALATASSLTERPVPPGLVVMGEVGLGGEVRPVQGLELRLREVARLGFAEALVPAANGTTSHGAVRARPVERLEEALAWLGPRREIARSVEIDSAPAGR